MSTSINKATGDQVAAADFNVVADAAGIYAPSSSGNDTYAVTLPIVPTGYAVGFGVKFKPDTGNTGACTLNTNGLGAKTIKKWTANGQVDLATGDILANQVVSVVYDGTYFVLISPVSKTGWAYLGNFASASGATLDCVLGSYTAFLCVFNNVISGNNNPTLQVATSNNGGSSYLGGPVTLSGTPSTSQVSNITGKLLIMGADGFGAGILEPNTQNANGTARYMTTAQISLVVNALRFSFSAGNFNGGSVDIYGI